MPKYACYAFFMKYEVEINPIKRRRAPLGLSQKDMADHLGITQSQCSRVEKLKTDPKKTY